MNISQAETVKIIKFEPEKCKECLECERACSKVHFGTEDGGKMSAIRIIKENSSLRMTNCNQCGLCIDVCPVEALSRRPNGVVWLNKNLCVACESCVGFCPGEGMRKAPGHLIPFKCISCGACVRACPESALKLEEVRLQEIKQVVYHRLGV